MATRLEDARPGSRLAAALAGLTPCVVAFSGGVDSGVVGAFAHARDPSGVLLATVTGPAVAEEEVERAVRTARTIGAPHRLLPLDPLNDGRYASNPPNRCYFCRSLEGDALRTLAREEGFPWVLDGIHQDDLGDDRPGIRAMNERGIRHPLLEAGLGKAEVRALARELGLPNWDAPSNSCLASRIRTGELITRETLVMVEAAEAVLHREGFTQVRVRTTRGMASIELGREEVPRLGGGPLLQRITQEIQGLGFARVTVDPEGYRPMGRRPRDPLAERP
jgi:uncharacterized protein